MGFLFKNKKEANVITNNEFEQFNIFLEIQLEHYLKYSGRRNLFGMSAKQSADLMVFIKNGWSQVSDEDKKEYSTKTRQELINILRKKPLSFLGM